MLQWDAVATVQTDHFAGARRALAELGQVGQTDFYNVLVVRLEDPAGALDDYLALLALDPGLGAAVAHFSPLERCWDFDSPEAFATGARQAALSFLPRLAGHSFHVRLHRRGFKGRIHSHEQEKALAELLLHELEQAGSPGRIDFDDPDAVVCIEMVGQRAGASLWTRDQRETYAFLHRG